MRTLLGTAFLVVHLVGCRQFSLPEAPISGATQAQQRLIVEELQRFDGWTDQQVQIGFVRLVEHPGGRRDELWGHYEPATSGIRIDRQLEGPALTSVLRHELCHALDHDADLSVDNRVFDELIDGALTDRAHPLRRYVEGADWRDLRAEAFAELCSVGPFGLVPLQRPCPGDGYEVGEPARFVSDYGFTAHDAHLSSLLSSAKAPIAPKQELPAPLATVSGVSSRDGTSGYFVAVSDVGQPISLALRLSDGGPADLENEYLATEAEVPRLPLGFVRHVQETPSGLAHDAARRLGGDVLAVARVSLEIVNITSAPRLLQHDADGWALVHDVCPGPTATLMAHEVGYLVEVQPDASGFSWREVP